MSLALIFHLIFVFAYAGMLVIRIAYHRKAKRARRDTQLHEGVPNLLARAVIGIGYITFLMLYAFSPGWFAWSSFQLPAGLRWLGAGLSLGSVALLWWIQSALDVQFNTNLHTQAGHRLIQHGPYRWVRHPMYTNFILMGAGWLLLTANWLVGVPLMLAILLIVAVRVRREEALMIAVFGEAYRQYMQRSGRFLPRWRAKSS
ncbi:MAG: isoprenylcysteine carboxylmethyltransferase family protein [Anaerolineales bacterium]|nr:isoprenylcysteine carboxylmethyltransferase family protein [Anaerolineales bacterium]